jgi:hypothetical protein
LKARQTPFALVLKAEERTLAQSLANAAHVHLQDVRYLRSREARFDERHVAHDRLRERIRRA